jgi:hypothetical protein
MEDRTLGTEIVAIYVGPKRKEFSVHKKLICSRSEYFSKAFKDGLQESEKGVMYLLEEDVTDFDALVNYIYRDTLPMFPCEISAKTVPPVNDYLNLCLLPLFLMAERFCLETLANKVMDAIQDVQLKQGIIFGRKILRCIYGRTREDSKLRSYAAICIVRNLMVIGGENNEKSRKTLSEFAAATPDFASDFVYLLGKHAQAFRKKPAADPQVRNEEKGFGKCYFHTHKKGEKCHLDEDQ